MTRGSLLRATAAVAFLASIASPVVSRASLLVVPDQYSTIQAALDAATSGDSVMVRAGSYNEALMLSGKDLRLFGESDSGSTTITTGGAGRILDLGAGVTNATVIERLMLREGLAARGGAVRCTGGASPIFRDCQFVSNTARSADSCSYGGAMFVDTGSLATIEGCLFLENFADASAGHGFFDGSGGALCVWAGARAEVRRSRFEHNIAAGFEGGWGGAVIMMPSTASFEDCVFTRNIAAEGGAILGRGGLMVRRCTFIANSQGAIACLEHSVAYCSVLGGASIDPSEIEESVFYDNQGSNGSTTSVEGTITLARNTLAFNQNASAVTVSPAVQSTNNIIAENDGIGLYCTGGQADRTITCNDVWMNGGGNYGGDCADLTGTNDNISVDPLFCDASSRDFHLLSSSPCTEQNSSCGAIGALGAGCGLIGVPDLGMRRAAILLAPQPTPSRGPVTIGFVLGESARVRIEMFDASGRRVEVVADAWYSAGYHRATWSSGHPGMYFVVMRTGAIWKARRAVMVR